MINPVRFALHRHGLSISLLHGEEKLKSLMKNTAQPQAAGKVLIKAGSDHEYVYRLVSGWACRTRAISDGRDQFILVFLPGDLFAVKSMFVSNHFDDVKMLSDGLVEKVHYEDLHRAYRSDPDIANRCMWQVVEEERRLHSWVFGLGVGSAEERLALLLVDFRGRLVLAGVLQSDAMSYRMPLTQVQLADHLGITSVHVNRILKSFRESGIATVRDGEVSIGDFNELVRRAYPLLDPYERKTSEYVGSYEHHG